MKAIISFLLITHTLGLYSQKISSDLTNIDPNEYFKPMKYRNIGPFRGGRSVTASGVNGDPLTYYMGTTGGGLWKTEDAGQHWNNISDGFFKTGSVGAVSVSESNSSIIYCGMGEHAPRGVMTHHGDGVYKSLDAGKTWKKIGLDKTQHISRIRIHPTNPDIVYVAAQGALYSRTEERGVYKSIDGGINWKKVLYVNNRSGSVELSMDMNNPHILYAAMWEHQRVPWQVISGGAGSGLYKSTDGGESWNKIHKGLPDEMGKMAIAVCRSNSDKVYALIESDTEKDLGGLFVSKDAGSSWKRISGDNRLTQRAWYYIEVFPDPQDEHTVYVMSAPALRSIDGGKTWERITGTHGDFHDLWINPENTKNLCIANDGGAAISFNRGKSWSRQSNMPTSQFYRVNVDNDFPYNIYGGQQDNSSIKIANRELNSSGINEQSWTYSAGGESAFLAFDPDDSRYVLGGSYLGTIEVLDTKAEAGTNIMAAPIQYLGMEAREMKYLFNWNAPIIWSQHEPNTYYHGAQYLLRTRDMGVTWEEVSPDLTRNQDAKQGKGGAPYTNEAVGAENYGTLSYVIESPHEKGVIWTGSDDGLVYITRNGGGDWTNVTPKGLKECLINAIDISPHDPGTVYIATTRYKFNDHKPGIYKTTDYGKTWTNINRGIPYGAFTRVVREDDKRKDLLFAGTETGIYVSFNGGKQWNLFQLNLPITPITDLIIRHDDLIVATSGRSFWILDDLGTIRQFKGSAKQLVVYEPENTILTNGSSELDGKNNKFKGTHLLRGVNPANGAVIYYELPKIEKKDNVILEILDSDGNLINSYSSKKDSTYKKYDGGPPAETVLTKKEGLNRFVWNLRNTTMKGVPETYIEGSYRGHKVSPGIYTIILKKDSQKTSTSLKISSNPLYSISTDTYAEYDKFMMEMENEYSEMHEAINTMYNAQNKIKKILKSLSSDDKYKEIKKEGNVLTSKMKSWDEEMIQRKSKAYDDVENFPNKFTANWLFVINHTESAIPNVNQPSKKRRAELELQWGELKKRKSEIMEVDLPALNKMFWNVGVGAVWVGED